MKKFAFISNNSDKANEIFERFSNKFELHNITENKLITEDVEAIIVAGGDGKLLRALHKYHHMNIPFIGINAGTLGFLTNDYITKSILDDLNDVETAKLHPISLKATDIDGKIYKKIAFNDVVLHRASNQASNLSISIDGKIKLEELVSDGIIISTPAGSSAYNFSAGGRIIPLNSRALCVTPVCPFRPRRWNGAIINDDANIEISISNYQKRPVYVVSDFNEIKNIKHVEIRKNESISVDLLFSSSEALNFRMIKEQFSF